MYPENDAEFYEDVVKTAKKHPTGGYEICFADVGCLFVDEPPIEPAVDMKARLYGRGFGSVVRGLFLDGHKVYYRTETEQKEYSEIQMYGADAADWLHRWDNDKSVWSIEMGGMGPGYEQCIQITTAEMLRYFIAQKFDFDLIESEGRWAAVRDEISKALHEVTIIQKLGLSGAQYGAAMSLAGQLYRKGPRIVMNEDAVKDRHIQVSKSFPSY